MAERRSFREIISNISYRDNRNTYKRSTGYNFFTDDYSTYGGNDDFLLGYNTRAGNFDIQGLGKGKFRIYGQPVFYHRDIGYFVIICVEGQYKKDNFIKRTPSDAFGLWRTSALCA